MALALDELRGAAAGPDRLADAAHRAGAAGDEVTPGRDDARRVVADVAHVDELDALGGGDRGARSARAASAPRGRPSPARRRRRPPRRTGRRGPGTPRGRRRTRLRGGTPRGEQVVHALTLLRAMTSFRNAEDRGGPLLLATCAGCRARPCRRSGPLAVTGTTTLPLVYYQGVTSIPRATCTSTASSSGSTAPIPRFTRPVAPTTSIPPDVARERGLQPHRRHQLGPRARAAASCCRSSATSPAGRTAATRACTARSASPTPRTLQWRYYVKLDPAEIPKAMWNEVSPDGTLLWTSSGDDLLAYRTADISLANAAPAHAPIHSVRRLKGAVPPTGDHRRRRSSTGGCSWPARTARRSASTRSTWPPGRAARDRAHDRRRVGGARDAGQGRDAGLAVQPFTRSGSRRPTARTTRRW